MDAINQKMQESKLDWKSNVFIVVDVDVEIDSLRPSDDILHFAQ
jgi:hypothetical protein